MPNHLTRPLLGCRLRDCGALDCPTCMGASAARQYLAELAEHDEADDECSHDEHKNGHCIECGADITDTLAGQAEDAADAAQDR